MTLNDLSQQIEATKAHTLKSLKHFEFSLGKIKKIPADFDLENLELLETYESFTSRFSRLSDIFSKKLLRSLVLKDDPSFKGGFMDILNQSEKLGFISDARKWWEIRSLSNKEAHEYTDEDLRQYFNEIKRQSSFVIQEVSTLIKKI